MKISPEGLKELREFVHNEKHSWSFVKTMRMRFETTSAVGLIDEVDAGSKEEAIGRAVRTAHRILSLLKEMGVKFDEVEPSHGIGHLIRGYLHALRLAKGMEVEPKQLFIGMLGGIFHDILGCIMVKRYDENKRAVRHAEGGGIFLHYLGSNVSLSLMERLIGFYGVAAHTHYLKPITVLCEDGVNRESTPYVDLDEFGKPIMCIHLTRWTDRLDVNGPTFFGRHFLTPEESHKDFDGENYYSVKFQNHMNPFPRNEEEIKNSGYKTMREHITMFAKSQNNQSPYGKYDYGIMSEIRDSYTARLLRIISAFDGSEKFSDDQKTALRKKWKQWLIHNIEPNKNTEFVAENLDRMFLSLNNKIKDRWYNVFSVVLQEYAGWAKDMLSAIEDFPEEYFLLPVLGDVRKILY